MRSCKCQLIRHFASINQRSLVNFDRHKILADNQHGFRAKRSCEAQLITTIQKIASSMSSKGQVDVILLDFAKAFDKVPYQRLLHKLDYYGVRNSTLRWIETFLSHRKQSVLLDGTRSTKQTFSQGCHKGQFSGHFSFWHL